MRNLFHNWDGTSNRLPDDDAAAIRKREADYERERLRHNFPDIDNYHDDLVLAIAKKMHTLQGALGEQTSERWELLQRVKQLADENEQLRARITELETGP